MHILRRLRFNHMHLISPAYICAPLHIYYLVKILNMCANILCLWAFAARQLELALITSPDSSPRRALRPICTGRLSRVAADPFASLGD